MTRILLALLGMSCFGTLALAENFKQPRNKNWLALASTSDKDQAIGIARHVRWEANSVRVVRAVNGYFAVIAGPYAARDIGQFRASAAGKNFNSLPKDALLSDGSRYVETVWQEIGDGSIGLHSYSLGKPVQLSAGAFVVRVSAEKLGSENAYTKIDGKDDKGEFHFEIGKDVPLEEQSSAEMMRSESFFHAAAVKLIAGSDSPQVVVTQFSGGAHCCTATYIAARDASAGAWSLTTSAPRDGDGFTYEDVDGDGAKELIAVDNAFLYAFDSYAGSVAPIQIYKLRDGKLQDVSLEPAMHSRLVQDLAGMEWEAKVQQDTRKTNGYLAGWVAAKIRLGQGDEAWRVFMRDYDHTSTFGPQECKSGKTVDDCAADDLQPIAIPKALAQFLSDNGYTPLPKAAQAELN